MLYYSRLAAVGTMVFAIIHEIRNRTSVLGSFVHFCKGKIDRLTQVGGKSFADRLGAVDATAKELDQLTDRFAPLAHRYHAQEEKKVCILEDQVDNCMRMRGLAGRIPVVFEGSGATKLAMYPVEVDSILLNLIANSAYWLGRVPARRRKITISIDLAAAGAGRVQVRFADTGPGIASGGADARSIFLPGFSTRPGGMGMGLTVIAELVAAAGGRFTCDDSVDEGAAFVFDLPLINKGNGVGGEDTGS
ncbi:MAG: HAMP domain-containing sensor histidine kinase [Betaproteobacteria bacterium]|nr:HAMP domain-containing sensor histidine kinase [Betaproteobacteria bacterium]